MSERVQFQIEDRLTTMMALTHSIQNRIVQSMAKGSMSEDVFREIHNHTQSIRQAAYDISKEKK